MATIYLQATINGQVAGTLWQDQQGIAHFAYDSSYHGAPLSVALPLKTSPFTTPSCFPTPLACFRIASGNAAPSRESSASAPTTPSPCLSILDSIALAAYSSFHYLKTGTRVSPILVPLHMNRYQTTRSPCALSPCETMMALHGWERMRAGRSVATRANSPWRGTMDLGTPRWDLPQPRTYSNTGSRDTSSRRSTNTYA